MWSILSKGRKIFFSPNRNLIDYQLRRNPGLLRFYGLPIPFLLQESGFYLLQENGSKIKL
jgi:hypothetical protein